MGLDLQDCLLIIGVLLLVAGTGAIYWPAGLILAGLLCLLFAFLIERRGADIGKEWGC
jgi:hypothetical protein